MFYKCSITYHLFQKISLLSSIPARAEDYSASYCLYVVELLQCPHLLALNCNYYNNMGDLFKRQQGGRF